MTNGVNVKENEDMLIRKWNSCRKMNAAACESSMFSFL